MVHINPICVKKKKAQWFAYSEEFSRKIAGQPMDWVILHVAVGHHSLLLGNKVFLGRIGTVITGLCSCSRGSMLS